MPRRYATPDLVSSRVPLTMPFLCLGAAIVGAVFNPWMVFYQPSAVVHKPLKPADCAVLLTHHRWSAGGRIPE